MPILRTLARAALMLVVGFVAVSLVATGVGKTTAYEGEVLFYVSENFYLIDVNKRTLHNLTLHDQITAYPYLSPSGRYAAFIIRGIVEADRELHIFDFWTNTRAMSLTLYGIDEVVWSPDESRLAYAAINPARGHYDIYVLDFATKTSINLTNHSAIDVGPTWSPDGQQIAFASSGRDTDAWQIYIVDADGSNLRRLTNNGCTNSRAWWSPDTSQIAIESGGCFNQLSSVFLINAETGAISRFPNPHDSNWGANWSPSGGYMLFNSGISRQFRGIYITNIQIGDVVLVAEGNRAIWSPDETQIAFESKVDTLQTADVDGTNREFLISFPGELVEVIGWRTQ